MFTFQIYSSLCIDLQVIERGHSTERHKKLSYEMYIVQSILFRWPSIWPQRTVRRHQTPPATAVHPLDGHLDHGAVARLYLALSDVARIPARTVHVRGGTNRAVARRPVQCPATRCLHLLLITICTRSPRRSYRLAIRLLRCLISLPGMRQPQ